MFSCFGQKLFSPFLISDMLCNVRVSLDHCQNLGVPSFFVREQLQVGARLKRGRTKRFKSIQHVTYPYNIKHASNENKENHQLGSIVLVNRTWTGSNRVLLLKSHFAWNKVIYYAQPDDHERRFLACCHLSDRFNPPTRFSTKVFFHTCYSI